MKINHLNLTVSDVLAAESFLATYFGLKSQGGNNSFKALFDDNGMVLTLMKGKRNVEVKYPETFHIGFIQESEEAVTAMYEWLKADGFDVAPPERNHAWTFYVFAPGGFTVEILA